MRAANIVNTLAHTTERLGDLLTQENLVLKDHKAHELSESRDEKDRLTSTYETEMSNLRRDPGLLKRSDPEVVDRLRKATNRFQEVLDEHRRLVQTAKSVTDRMVKSITDEVSKRERPVSAYDASATMRTNVGRQAKPVSLALNQVI